MKNRLLQVSGIMLSVLFSFLSTNSARAQKITLQEDFTGYVGTTSTAPAGWYVSKNGSNSSTGTYYTSTTSSGKSGPNSYKYNATGVTMTTPYFAESDSLTFWIKGSQTDSISSLTVLWSNDSIVWDTLDVILPLPTQSAKGRLGYSLPLNVHYLSFVYFKSAGNLAFDDFMTFTVLPTAGFTNNNTCQGDTTYFTDLSTTYNGNITSWHWDFGDGNMDMMNASPSHQYAAPGLYLVSLVVSDDRNEYDTVLTTVTVGHLPSVSFSTTGSCALNDILFSNTSTVLNDSIVSTFFDFGDGSPSDTALFSATHMYAAYGNYTVTATAVSSSGCMGQSTAAVNINPLPVLSTTGGNACDTDGVSLQATATVPSGSIQGYLWDLGDGNTSFSQNVNHTYASPGNYTAQLYATTDAGCIDSSVVSVSVYPKPVAGFSIMEMGNMVMFTDTSTIASGFISAVSFDMGDGTFSSDSVYTHTYNNNGIFQVCQTVTSDQGCTDTYCTNVSVTGVSVLESAIAPLVLYPNPSDGHISLSGIDGVADILIYDLCGKLICTMHLDTIEKVDASHLAEGSYVFKVLTDNYLYSKRIQIVR